jgi:hypothetical protein
MNAEPFDSSFFIVPLGLQTASPIEFKRSKFIGDQGGDDEQLDLDPAILSGKYIRHQEGEGDRQEHQFADWTTKNNLALFQYQFYSVIWNEHRHSYPKCNPFLKYPLIFRFCFTCFIPVSFILLFARDRYPKSKDEGNVESTRKWPWRSTSNC